MKLLKSCGFFPLSDISDLVIRDVKRSIDKPATNKRPKTLDVEQATSWTHDR